MRIGASTRRGHARRRGLASIALGLGVALLAGCGGGTPQAAAPTDTTPPPPFFGTAVPKTLSAPVWTAGDGTDGTSSLSSVVAGSGVIATALSNGRIRVFDAVTGRGRWQGQTLNASELVTDATGPADDGSGVLVATDNTTIPQNGLIPAVRTLNVVGLNAADGKERWRYEVYRAPVDTEDAESVVAIRARSGAVAVTTTSHLFVLDAATGAERWQKAISVSPPAFSSQLAEGYYGLAMGPATVVTTAQLPGARSELTSYELETGKIRWYASAASLTRFSSPTFGALQIGADRVLVGVWSQPDLQEQRTASVRGYDLTRGGKAVWELPGSGGQTGYTVDYSEGTVLRITGGLLEALNIRDGKRRWIQPAGVTTKQVAARGGVSYIVAESGGDSQVVVLRTADGSQKSTSAGRGVTGMTLFDGAAVLRVDAKLALYR